MPIPRVKHWVWRLLTAGQFYDALIALLAAAAGVVASLNEPFAAKRFAEIYEDYVRELLRYWSYVEQDARKLNPATKAWMAVPLVHPGSKIQGILYLDSTDRGYFTAARQQLVFKAASGVVRFVIRRCCNP